MKKNIIKCLLTSLLGLGLFSCEEGIEPSEIPTETVGVEIKNPRGVQDFSPTQHNYSFKFGYIDRVGMPTDPALFKWEVSYIGIRYHGGYSTEHVSGWIDEVGVNQKRQIDIPFVNIHGIGEWAMSVQEFNVKMIAFVTEADIIEHGDIMHEAVIYYRKNGSIYYTPETRKTKLITASDLSSGEYKSSLQLNYAPFAYSPYEAYYVENRIYPVNDPEPQETWILDQGLLNADLGIGRSVSGLTLDPCLFGQCTTLFDPCLIGPCELDPGF